MVEFIPTDKLVESRQIDFFERWVQSAIRVVSLITPFERVKRGAFEKIGKFVYEKIEQSLREPYQTEEIQTIINDSTHDLFDSLNIQLLYLPPELNEKIVDFYFELIAILAKDASDRSEEDISRLWSILEDIVNNFRKFLGLEEIKLPTVSPLIQYRFFT